LRRLLRVIAFLCTLVVGAASMAVIVTQTTWFKEWLRGFIVQQAAAYVNGRLSIGRLDGNLFYGVEMQNIAITQDGRPVVTIRDAGLRYDPISFIAGHAVIDTIRLNQPVIHARKDGDTWNLTQLIKARTPDPDKPRTRPAIEIGELGVSDGTVIVDTPEAAPAAVRLPATVDHLDASFGISSDAKALTVRINHVSLRTDRPSFGINDLSGRITRTENTVSFSNVSLRTQESSLRVTGSIAGIEEGQRSLDLHVSSDKLDVQEFGTLVPAMRGYRLQPALEMSAVGALDRLKVDMNVRDVTLGHAIASLTVDAEAPGRRVAGGVTMTHFNIAPIAGRRADGTASAGIATDVTGTATIDLALPEGRLPLSGTYTLMATRAALAGYEASDVRARGRLDDRVVRVDAASARGYDATATAAGTIRIGAPLTLDLSGRAAHVDMRRLPRQLNVPAAASDLTFAYTLVARGPVLSGDALLDRSTVAGATIADGATGTYRFGGGAPAYSGRGDASNVDVQEIGRAFGIAAISTDRFRGRLNGTFDMSGTGGGRYPLTIDATGTLTDSDMFGARFPRLDFTTNLASGDAHVKAIGSFEHLDPSTLTDNRNLKGDLTGAADLTTTFRGYANGITVDSVDVAGRVNLGMSTFAGFSIDTGVFDGRYADRTGQLTQLAITGSDINVQGSGPIALDEQGASNLTLHVESTSLERLGKAIGQPIDGGVVVDATVTGNARSLVAAGTLKGSNARYGDVSALSMNSTFTLTLPDLKPSDLAVKAATTATFVEVAGQKINEVVADTAYNRQTLEFNGTAKQLQRELTASGSMIVHPDHREVHVQDLALRTEGIAWTTAPGMVATVRYGGPERVEVENLKLLSGSQTIEASGSIGSPSSPLHVRATGVDVAQLDTLLLGDQRLAGRLTGTADITGAATSPRVKGTFTLSQGAFRQFTFESLAGSVDYAGRGMTVDVKLQQNPDAWITAKGFAPISLLRANPPGVGEDHVAAATGEAVDLQIASSQIDLGLVQGFTSFVTNVTGKLQANVRVSGSGYDPHLTGAIDIRGGAFAVPTLGTGYTGLDTRIDLKPDSVAITEMRILDHHGQPMTVGGTLGVHERSVGSLDMTVKSDTFEVFDNKLGHLKLDTDLKLTGNLHAPKLIGSVDIHTGTLNVAEIIAQTTGDPYLADPNAVRSDWAGPVPTVRVPPIFDALDLSVGLAIPGNLVLIGNNIKPANAPINIGDITATVGGILQLRKTPHDILSITGDVNTVRGSYTFQGRRFEILRDGRIRFFGGDELDPYLDLRARRVIAGIETFVRIQGTMRTPELSFTSTPPLEEADILSLIVFNQPINELGEGQQVSLTEQAAAFAGGYLASGLATSIGNALSLDEFQIQAQGEGTTGPQLTIGEQVGDNLFVRIRQGFGPEQATEFILEYQIREYLRLQSTAAEAQGGTQRTTFRRIRTRRDRPHLLLQLLGGSREQGARSEEHGARSTEPPRGGP
jgi:autotransporter translocation and assembly factor TamB